MARYKISDMERIEIDAHKRVIYVDNRPDGYSWRHTEYPEPILHVQDRTGYIKNTIRGDEDSLNITVCGRVFDYGMYLFHYGDTLIGNHHIEDGELNEQYILDHYDKRVCPKCGGIKAILEAHEDWNNALKEANRQYKEKQEREEKERKERLEIEKIATSNLYDTLIERGFEVSKGNKKGEYPLYSLTIKYNGQSFTVTV